MFRILLVDDSEPFRRLLSWALQNRPEMQVVGEVSDGLEAVQKAQELRPDLILLDIGLPKLNGIEAARRIRKLSPNSKILFLSQESSADVLQEALGTGAMGYVVKADVASELLIAVNAVLRGETFISSRYGGHDFEPASKGGQRSRVQAPLQTENAKLTRRHEVGFYSDDASLLEGFTQFIGAALKAGNAAIVVATESHRDGLLPRLHAHGSDIGAAIEQGRYISLDVADTLSTFMVNGLPDRARFWEVVGDLIVGAAEFAKAEQPRVAACGECAPLLWAQGKVEEAIRLEHLWDEIAKTHEVDILCGYPLDSFQGVLGRRIFQRICAEHSAASSSGFGVRL